ncbi:hypothetical protein AGDE_04748 [Angomonas deanei]|uniref:Uncharacterized protein n=1 Tax=Angomonas deanei TaxID=59799 RepID=A0A7G2CAP3_9TRYP|nr:hypothetical protein AGDE_04748 [Angomonas deanei]CAD2216525.1 hypothetical protein, conserved [Angomonas deanei]|eukprot:EPY39181.1 hypothetical protein AGDE_04748 [Angomonas deanei]
MGMGMGMGMYGMTPEAQRGQMMMFMISSMVQLWGMLSQVVQGTLGSVVQFVGNYVGLNQRLAQVEEEGMVQEEHYRRRCVQFKKDLENVPIDREEIKQRKRHARLHSKSKQPSLLRKIIISVIRHTLLLVLAYFMSKRITTLLSKKPTPQLL